MGVLYAEKRLDIAFEAGRKAADLAMQNNFDIHMRDAAAKCLLEVNAIVSPHDDDVPKGSTLEIPADEAGIATLLQSKISEAESQIPKGATGVDPASINPMLLLALTEIGKLAFALIRKRFGF